MAYRNGEIRVILDSESVLNKIQTEVDYYDKYYFKVYLQPSVLDNYPHKLIFHLATQGPLNSLRDSIAKIHGVVAAQIYYH